MYRLIRVLFFQCDPFFEVVLTRIRRFTRELLSCARLCVRGRSLLATSRLSLYTQQTGVPSLLRPWQKRAKRVRAREVLCFPWAIMALFQQHSEIGCLALFGPRVFS